MSLLELTVRDLRCLELAELTLHPQRNLIWGANGAGKTSLLEAIFLLGRGRSFRTRNSERLIRQGSSSLTVFGRLEDTQAGGIGVPVGIGVQVSRSGGTVAHVRGSPATSLTELSQAFPVQVIDPGVHKLVEEGGHRRRRWLDWAVFHVEPGFAPQWVRYNRTLKQRNAALRQPGHDTGPWDVELARLGELISQSRRVVMMSLSSVWAQTVRALTDLEVDLTYYQGWSAEHPLEQALAQSRVRDVGRGLTHAGPHRADVLVRLGGRAAREVLSRGQQKLVAVAMILSQIRLLQETLGIHPTLLLDDPAAELDGTHLRRFIDAVQPLRCQLVLTSLQPGADLFGSPDKTFHVERGRINPV